MRIVIILLALLSAGCWTPGARQLDPTRYPWDQRKPEGSYCVVTLEAGSATGITTGGGNAVNLECRGPH